MMGNMRLKGPCSLLSSFSVCYKNNFGYKCLHSTDFILKPASSLSHPSGSVNCMLTQLSRLLLLILKGQGLYVGFFLIGNDSAIIQTTNYNALKVPTPVGLDERFHLHAAVVKDYEACSR